MKTSQQFQKILAGLSLMVLALGFTLIGFVSILHRPLSTEELEVGATISTLIGGCAGMGAGATFSLASLVYWRRVLGRSTMAPGVFD
jgi:hypothetical protein